MSDISLLCCSWNLGDGFSRFCERLRRIETYFQEIIICDDGSTDSTQEKLQLNFSNNKKYTLKFFQDNSGRPSRSRNYGLDHAKSKYLMFLDWDDFISFDYLNYVKKNIDETKIITGTKFATADVDRWIDLASISEANSVPITHFMQRHCNFITLSGSTLSTKISQRARFQNLPLEDWLFWKSLLKTSPCLKIEKVSLPIQYSVQPSLSPKKFKQIQRVYNVTGKFGLLCYFLMKFYLFILERRLKHLVVTRNE